LDWFGPERADLIKIHTSDGQTHRIDFTDQAEADAWIERLKSQRFQSSITGISIVGQNETRARCTECGAKAAGQIGVQYSVTRPQDFRVIEYEIDTVAESGSVKGGWRLVLYADDVRLVLMVHRSQPSARITISKVGKRRFRP
jgi:hypothetical protein